MPPPVAAQLERPLVDYWRERLRQHQHDSYAGVPFGKFPEDLRVYEHLLWDSRADVVIELGTDRGGGALWFRDRLRAMQGYGRSEGALVVAVDLSLAEARAAVADIDPRYEETITFVEGDVTDPELPERVARVLPPDARCLVSEDSAHTYQSTSAALEGFARFVPVGGYFVVEDGVVDVEALRIHEPWPRGVLAASEDWLAGEQGAAWRLRRDLELYGVTCHPHGFLQRTR